MTIDPVRLTQELVRARTVNPPGDEHRCMTPLASMLEDAGFSVARVDLAPGRPNLVARHGGDGAAVAFTGHVDVVPLGDAPWTADPFGGEIENGRLYGRGSTDMKSGVAAVVAAATRHARAGGTRPVELVITSSEETDLEGARVVAAAEGLLGEATALVVAEPTGNLAAWGYPSIAWLRLTFEGKTAHAAQPHLGRNAALMAARAALALQDYRLRDIHHPLLGRSTLNVGRLISGDNFNSVPDRAELGLDFRLVPGISSQDVLEDLAGIIEDPHAVDVVSDVGGVCSDETTAWLQRALSIVTSVTGERAHKRAVPYSTDASILTPALGNVPTLILGPGELEQAHQTDEFCYVDKIEQATEVYLALMRDS